MHVHVCICVHTGCWIRNSIKVIFVPIAHLSLRKAEAGYTVFSPKMPRASSNNPGLKSKFVATHIFKLSLPGKEPEHWALETFLQWGSRRGRRLSRFTTFLRWLF